jgi:hypothetical protein
VNRSRIGDLPTPADFFAMQSFLTTINFRDQRVFLEASVSVSVTLNIPTGIFKTVLDRTLS